MATFLTQSSSLFPQVTLERSKISHSMFTGAIQRAFHAESREEDDVRNLTLLLMPFRQERAVEFPIVSKLTSLNLFFMCEESIVTHLVVTKRITIICCQENDSRKYFRSLKLKLRLIGQPWVSPAEVNLL